MKPPLYEAYRTRVVYVRLRELNTMSNSVDSYRIEWLDRDKRWAHWAQVLYLPMAKKIAQDRSEELYTRDSASVRTDYWHLAGSLARMEKLETEGDD